MKERNTSQKRIMEEELDKINTFFDAERLHQTAIKREKNIGIATIYRFLKRMTSEGRLHSYICSRKTVYSKKDKGHCHFICKKCQARQHITLKALDFLKNEIPGEICHFQIDVTGICEECKKKN
jgi:Fur family ferric uptake transcriptional regulator